MIELGKYNTLAITRKTAQGLYLGETDVEEVLLPWKYAPANAKEGDEISVFVYNDSEDRMVATTLEPKITLHQFAHLRVKDVTAHGAFLDWGLEKDLFVPFREQPRKMLKGKSYLVYLYLDEESERLVASARITRFLNNKELTVKEGDEVEILIWESTELGVNVIINQRHKGLIYHNEFFAQAQPGEVRRGFIGKIREDNKMDVLLQKPGYENIEPNLEKILNTLRERGGFLPLTDKSEPQEIAKLLEMSKKTFKKAIGSLYKQRSIRLEDDGIYLS
ncbi:MAG: S1-like domain-containing RNA-binding protein [Saprospiraceae bacterium]|nr:S1-like domain-containing RNA-binding protein [Saprospiraceae bacterium]